MIHDDRNTLNDKGVEVALLAILAFFALVVVGLLTFSVVVDDTGTAHYERLEELPISFSRYDSGDKLAADRRTWRRCKRSCQSLDNQEMVPTGDCVSAM